MIKGLNTELRGTSLRLATIKQKLSVPTVFLYETVHSYRDCDGYNEIQYNQLVLSGYPRGNNRRLLNRVCWKLDNARYFSAKRRE